MPRPMTMQRPYSRIILLPLQHDITRRRGQRIRNRSIQRLLNNMRVPSLRVIGIGDVAVVVTVAFGEDEEIVSVEVHGVGGVEVGDVVAEDHADGGVGTEVVDVPLGVGGVRCVAVVREVEDWMTRFVMCVSRGMNALREVVLLVLDLLVVGVECRIIHEPLPASVRSVCFTRSRRVRAVVMELDVDDLGDRWLQWLPKII